MWKSFFTILCASGTVFAYYQPQSVLANGPPNNCTRNGKPARIIRRYACPDGFVRLRRNCFYFSAGKASWQEAHFFCQDRNATLATLPKKHMDRRLREYLQGPQMKQLERWIGARYNWENQVWLWGVSSEKIAYDGFSKLRSGSDQTYKWHCAVMNPERKFRWAVRNCIDNKHYVCQKEAAEIEKLCGQSRPGGLRKRGPKRKRPSLESNGPSTRNTIKGNDIMPNQNRGAVRSTRRSRRPMWGNGMKLGMRGPAESTRWAPGAKSSDRLTLSKGKGPNEPDVLVSRDSKVAKLNENHIDSEPEKKFSKKNTESFWIGPETLSEEKILVKN